MSAPVTGGRLASILHWEPERDAGGIWPDDTMDVTTLRYVWRVSWATQQLARRRE